MKRIISITLFFCLLLGIVQGGYAFASSSELVRFQGSNGKYGYRNSSGEEVIKPTYESAQEFSNGYAVVQFNKGGYCCCQYIDEQGKVVIPCIDTKSNLYGYNEWQGDYGVVDIWKKTKSGIEINGYNYILPDGHLLNNETYLYVGNFSEGYALVGVKSGANTSKMTRNSSGTEHWLSNSLKVAADTYYYIDMEGNRLGNSTWSYGTAFKNGFAPVAVTAANGSYLWGLIDNSGELVVSPQWAGISVFYDGLARVSDGENWGFIDMTGSLVIPCIFQYACNFSEGLACVKVDDNYGYIDKTGEFIIPATYQSAGSFSNGTAIVTSGVAYGVIDSNGNSIIPSAYETLEQIGDSNLYFAKEYASTMIYNENNELVTILLIDGDLPSEEDLSEYEDGTECTLIELPIESSPIDMFCFVDNNGRVISMNIAKPSGSQFHISFGTGKGVIVDNNGNLVSDGEWDDVKSDASSGDRICVLKNNLYGYIDLEGNVVIPPKYTDAGGFVGDTATVWIGQNSYTIDKNGKEVLPSLQKGDKGEKVKMLQQALIDQGFLSGDADGSFGKMTAEAVMAAQEQFGFEQTGIADSDLQNALYETK